MSAFPHLLRHPRTVPVLIVGAGQSGLAMSYWLSAARVGHLLLERGGVGESWRQRWDSLRLLTPNWQCRLPGMAYDGDDPDGYMRAAEVNAVLRRYSQRIGAPVETGVQVLSAVRDGEGYRVETSAGPWRCQALVIASGACAAPAIPALARALPPSILQRSALDYRKPGSLPDGKVLVVGASATGLQLAEEIHASGRPVTLAVGEHVRLPRSYRGRDIQWWLEAIGLADERYTEVDDLRRARAVSSPQLIGSPRSLDLNSLQAAGVRLTGRLAGIDGDRAQFGGGLDNLLALADLKLGRLLRRIDNWVEGAGLAAQLPPAAPVAATRLAHRPPLLLDLRREGFSAVLWATGFRPDYAWLQVPVFDRRGVMCHDGGVAASPGLYVLGLPFLRRRKSSFIHGAGDDARELSQHLLGFLRQKSRAVA